MAKYLITGITGFVGPHLAKLLIDKGHEVYGFVRSTNGRENDIRDVLTDNYYSKINFIYGDFCFPETVDKVFRETKFDGVFHLGAQSHPPTSFKDPVGTFEANANGTINLVEAIAEFQPKCKFMMCSTSEVYGAVPLDTGEIDENFPIKPMNPYGVGKSAGDMYVRERAKNLGLKFFTTRAFSHTGPRRGNNFSISSDAYQLIRIKKAYQKKVIHVGTLSSKRVIMDVRDCVKAYYKLMNNFEPGETYNVGGDDAFTMGELNDKMIEMSGLTGKIEKYLDPKLVRPIDIPIQICNTKKCRNLTGWKPELKVDQILKDLLNYWEHKIK